MKSKRKLPAKACPPPAASTYEPTEADRSAARQFLKRGEGRAKLAPVTVTRTERGRSVGWEHPEPALATIAFANVLQTDDQTFARVMMLQTAGMAHDGGDLTSESASFAASIIRAVAPRDPTEALLASQMAAVQMVLSKAAQRVADSELLPHYEIAMRAVNQLARTFAAQVDTLKRWRATGEQVVRVQHVNVNAGAQAIVGNVQAGGGGAPKCERQPLEPSSTGEPGPALLGHEQAHPVPMPGAGTEGVECVPVPRSAGRGRGGDG